MKSRTTLNTSIFVTSIAILGILLIWFSSLLFKISLNSPVYYGIVIVLTVASIVFGILQLTPVLLTLRHTRSERQTPLTSEELETENEQQAFYDSLASTLTELPAKQRQTVLYTLFHNEMERINLSSRSKEQNYPLKVTMEVKGTPVTIEMSDVEKVENIIKGVEQAIQASTNVTNNAAQDHDSFQVPVAPDTFTRQARIPQAYPQVPEQ